jgi:heparanase
MNKGRSGALRAGATIGALVAAVRCASPASAAPASVAPDTLPRIATVDERYQSYNVEMAEVIGGEFWKPYAKQGRAAGATMFEARPPIDLADARLRKLAAALGPAYMRVSGTWANAVYFADSD